MSDFLDPDSMEIVPLDEKGKKEQARLRKKYGFDENGKKIDASASAPEHKKAA
jgi:hypothetical protein